MDGTIVAAFRRGFRRSLPWTLAAAALLELTRGASADPADSALAAVLNAVIWSAVAGVALVLRDGYRASSGSGSSRAATGGQGERRSTVGTLASRGPMLLASTSPTDSLAIGRLWPGESIELRIPAGFVGEGEVHEGTLYLTRARQMFISGESHAIRELPPPLHDVRIGRTVGMRSHVDVGSARLMLPTREVVAYMAALEPLLPAPARRARRRR